MEATNYLLLRAYSSDECDTYCMYAIVRVTNELIINLENLKECSNTLKKYHTNEFGSCSVEEVHKNIKDLIFIEGIESGYGDNFFSKDETDDYWKIISLTQKQCDEMIFFVVNSYKSEKVTLDNDGEIVFTADVYTSSGYERLKTHKVYVDEIINVLKKTLKEICYEDK